MGTAGVIAYGALGVAQGLAQQSPTLPPGEIDCGYRVNLLRDRVVAMTERSPHQRADDPQDEIVSNLIRETRAACASRGDVANTLRLDEIAGRLRDHLELRSREDQVRRDLLAL